MIALVEWVPQLTYAIIAICILIILLVFKKSVKEVDLKNWKIQFAKKFENNYVQQCQLCKIRVSNIAKDCALLGVEIGKIQYVISINEQFRVLDRKLTLLDSIVFDFHTTILNERVEFDKISDNNKLNIIEKNLQILNYVWLVKRNMTEAYLKQAIFENSFCSLEFLNLKKYTDSKLDVLMALVEKNKIYPDWDGNEILYTRAEYLHLLHTRLSNESQSIFLDMFKECQDIQKKYNEEIRKLEMKIEAKAMFDPNVIDSREMLKKAII